MLLAWLGAAVIVGLLVVMLAADTLRLQPSVGRSFPRTLMLALLVLGVVVAAKIFSQLGTSDAAGTFFLVVAAMVVTIAYSQVFALAMAGLTIFLVAIATRADLDWAITAAVGTSVAILALGEINNRTVLVRVGALAGLGFFLAKAALGFWRLEGAGHVLGSAALYFGVGLGAGVVLLALLPYIERVFGIVTNISLLELCDVNQPALRRLALEAPGTYTHSLLIGSLAEAACEAIGANGLLARVGAYFHDIGKAAKPHYFIENWEEGENGHAGLTPETSSQVIMNHVKDGLEMAGRVGLPPILKQFIAEHHGTTQMAYFWREAVRRQKAEGGPVPRESDYRYAGPKPRSRETALVMLADAVEGATRSQDDRSAAKNRRDGPPDPHESPPGRPTRPERSDPDGPPHGRGDLDEDAPFCLSWARALSDGASDRRAADPAREGKERHRRRSGQRRADAVTRAPADAARRRSTGQQRRRDLRAACRTQLTEQPWPRLKLRTCRIMSNWTRS